MNRFLLVATAVSATLAYSAKPSIAATVGDVALGSNYFQTTSTVIDFGGSIGPITLTGNPIGPGNTDTIIQRQADAIIGGPAIPIQLTALSLRSSAPVNIGGTFSDVFVTLDPANLDEDTGTMSVTGSLSDGTLNAFLSAALIAEYHTSNGEETVRESVSLNFTKVEFKNIGMANGVQEVGFDCDPSPTVSCSLAQMAADQNANVHTGLAPDEIDIFTPLDATVIPLPTALPLFATALGGLGLLGWRRKRKARAVGIARAPA